MRGPRVPRPVRRSFALKRALNRRKAAAACPTSRWIVRPRQRLLIHSANSDENPAEAAAGMLRARLSAKLLRVGRRRREFRILASQGRTERRRGRQRFPQRRAFTGFVFDPEAQTRREAAPAQSARESLPTNWSFNAFPRLLCAWDKFG